MTNDQRKKKQLTVEKWLQRTKNFMSIFILSYQIYFEQRAAIKKK